VVHVGELAHGAQCALDAVVYLFRGQVDELGRDAGDDPLKVKPLLQGLIGLLALGDIGMGADQPIGAAPSVTEGDASR